MSHRGQVSGELEEFWSGCSELAAVLEEVSRYGTAPGLESAYTVVRAGLMRVYPGVAEAVRSWFPLVQAPSTRGSQDFIDALLASPTAATAVNRLGSDIQRVLGLLRATVVAEPAH